MTSPADRQNSKKSPDSQWAMSWTSLSILMTEVIGLQIYRLKKWQSLEVHRRTFSPSSDLPLNGLPTKAADSFSAALQSFKG